RVRPSAPTPTAHTRTSSSRTTSSACRASASPARRTSTTPGLRAAVNQDTRPRVVVGTTGRTDGRVYRYPGPAVRVRLGCIALIVSFAAGAAATPAATGGKTLYVGANGSD